MTPPRIDLDERCPIVPLDEIDSTNLHARRRIRTGALNAEAAAGVCPFFTAARQSGGVGRFGRAWASPAGGLWTTWIVPPAVVSASNLGGHAIGSAGLCAGVACLEAIREVMCAALERDGETTRVQLKWPNDVLIDGRKVCGVLCEVVQAAADNGRGNWLLVGQSAGGPDDMPRNKAFK